MKTTVESVTVEMIVDGHRAFYNFTIATRGGALMTKRLQKILAGNIVSSYRGQHDHLYGDWALDIQFVGVVWSPPYQLLREIAEDRKELQRELFYMEGASDLTEYPTLTVPMKECSHKISELVQTELKLRKQIKKRLKELDDIKTMRDDADEESDVLCQAWEIDSISTPKPYEW